MKRIIKSRIFTFILGGLLLGSVGVYAATNYAASKISYKNTTVESALDDLYGKKYNNFEFIGSKAVEDKNLLNYSYTSNFSGKLLILITHVQGENAPSKLTKNDNNIDLTIESFPPGRQVEHAVIDVNVGDTITCESSTASAVGYSNKDVIWSYTSCSLFGLK